MSTKEAEEESLENILDELPKMLAKRQKLMEEREKELEKAVQAFEREKANFCGSNYKPSDVLQLNVGGTVIAVLRRTITSVEGSMLASRFSGRWDDSIEKDRDGNFFIDQPIELFQPMIDYLRAKSCETPLSHAAVPPDLDFFLKNKRKYNDFKRMVDYYGMVPGIYPTEIKVHCGKKEDSDVSSYPEHGVTAKEWSVFKIVRLGHGRHVSSFEVTLDEVESMQIGWMSPYHNHWAEDLSSSGSAGVGEHADSLGLDCVRSGFSASGSFSKVEGLSFGKGAVVRCEDQGAKWFVNGEVVQTSLNKQAAYIPAFSGKGKWRVSKVELAVDS